MRAQRIFRSLIGWIAAILWPAIAVSEMAVVRIEPEFDRLISSDAAIEILAEGHDWTEGPVWDEAEQRLLFSDVPRNTIYAWSAASGRTVYMKPSGYTGVAAAGREPGSNGLAFDAEGRLLLCEHGDRRIARVEHCGGKLTLADRFDGKRLNSPNDLAVHSDGSIVFTDPPYGLPKGANDPCRELDFFGVYRLSPEGDLTLLIQDLTRPNGIAFSPDERTLYVAQSHRPEPVIFAYPYSGDGKAGEGRVFFDATPFVSSGPGLPDGLKTDREGNVWTTGPNGVFVLSPDGKLLGRIVTGKATANLAFGGPDGQTLFITAHDALLRVPTLTRAPLTKVQTDDSRP